MTFGMGSIRVFKGQTPGKSEFWQPVEGEPVRYIWQPECPGVYPGDGSYSAEKYGAAPGHPVELDGEIGLVYEILPEGNHPYMAAFGERRIQCAALELRPV